MRLTRKHRQTEHIMQCAVIAACKSLERLYPELKYLMAIPNGGQRHPAVAAKLKAEGVKSGVPDLFLPVPIPGVSAGLWIEMKSPKGVLTENQENCLRFLKDIGFDTLVCRSAIQAVDAIKLYMRTRKGVINCPSYSGYKVMGQNNV